MTEESVTDRPLFHLSLGGSRFPVTVRGCIALAVDVAIISLLLFAGLQLRESQEDRNTRLLILANLFSAHCLNSQVAQDDSYLHSNASDFESILTLSAAVRKQRETTCEAALEYLEENGFYVYEVNNTLEIPDEYRNIYGSSDESGNGVPKDVYVFEE